MPIVLTLLPLCQLPGKMQERRVLPGTSIVQEIQIQSKSTTLKRRAENRCTTVNEHVKLHAGFKILSIELGERFKGIRRVDTRSIH